MRVSITDFGAKSGGPAAANAAAIAAANEAAAHEPCGWLHIPAGRYEVDRGIEYKVPIRGDGGHAHTSVIEGTWKDGQTPWLSIEGEKRAALDGFAIFGPKAKSEDSIVGIRAAGSNRYSARDLHIRCCAVPVTWDGWVGRWDGCHFKFNYHGPRVSMANGVGFYGGASEGNAGHGLVWESGSGGSIAGMTIEGNGGTQLEVRKCSGLKIDACYFEGDKAARGGAIIHIGAGGSASTDCTNVTIDTCHIPGGMERLIFENCHDLTISNCRLISYVEVGENARQIRAVASGPRTDDTGGNSRWRVHRNARTDVFRRGDGVNLIGPEYLPRIAAGRFHLTDETEIKNPWRTPAHRLTAQNADHTWHVEIDLGKEAVAAINRMAPTELYGGCWVYVPSGQSWVADNSGLKVTSRLALTVDGKTVFSKTGTNQLALDHWNWCNARALPVSEGQPIESAQLHVGVFGTSGGKPKPGDYLICTGPVVATPDKCSRHELPFIAGIEA